MKKIIVALICLVGLSSCASMMQVYCTPNAAYASGVNDAKNQQDMRISYGASCPANQAELNNQYRQGYQFGLQNSPQNINVNVNTRSRHHHRASGFNQPPFKPFDQSTKYKQQPVPISKMGN